MQEINSPLGRKVISSGTSSPPRQMFSIPDEEQKQVQLTPEQFAEFQSKKIETKQISKKPTTEAKLRIEILTGIGRLQSDVIIGENKFSLQSLKSGEMREIIKSISNITSGTDASYELRTQVLAKSLYAIDDKPTDLVIGAVSLEDTMHFINDLQESVVNKLYKGYTTMIEDNEDKMVVSTVEQAKEVSEEVKKA